MKWAKFLPISRNGQFRGLGVTYITLSLLKNSQIRLKIRHNAHFTLKTLEMLKKHVCTVHAPNKKDAMMSGCLDRKEVRSVIWGVHSTTERSAGGKTGRLFLAFGGPVCADRFSKLSIG